MLGVLCPDAFVMRLIYVPKTVQIVKRILLPHFLLVESRNSPDTAHTNSSREQLPVTKKAVSCVWESYGKGGIV